LKSLEEKILSEFIKLNKNVEEMKEDIDKIYDRLDLRDQYLQMLTVMHDEIKNIATTRVLEKNLKK